MSLDAEPQPIFSALWDKGGYQSLRPGDDGRTVRRYSDELQQSEQPRYQPEYQEVPEEYPQESGPGAQPSSRRRTRDTRPPITSSTSTRGTRRKSVSFPESSRQAELVPAQGSRHERRYHGSRGYNQSREGERSDDRSPYETYRTPRPDPTIGGEQESYYEDNASVDSAAGELERMTMQDPDLVTGPHYKFSPPQPSAGLPWSANVGEARGSSRPRPPIPVAGDPHAGPTEKLDPSFRIRNNDYKTFFRCGRVFKTLWTDPAGPMTASENSQFMSKVRFRVAHGEYVYSKIRRFVVVTQGNRSCQCLPVTTYDGKGYAKRGINLDEHGLIYNSDEAPVNVAGITKYPLRVKPSKNGERLTGNSYINYGRAYCVDTNVKVKDVGELDSASRKWLREYYKEIHFPPDEDMTGPSYSKPPSQSTQLLGITGNADDYVYGLQGTQAEASMTSRSSRSAVKRRQSSSSYQPDDTWTEAEAVGQYQSGTQYSEDYDRDAPGSASPQWPPADESHIPHDSAHFIPPQPSAQDEYGYEQQEHYEQAPLSGSIEDPNYSPPVGPPPQQTSELEQAGYDEEIVLPQPQIPSSSREKHRRSHRERDRDSDRRKHRH
ncbi:uncharacterized protein PAC_17105 [Phialocephala subalpina]|uniref:DUF6590 domain-containing protein n=1 Tax=Phialocephala subalpina TaxID=576137 RepID=A0A1L7XQ86_9HELO|nr:uncharacterized protein PAC_17105 [Phialocephala subalpina]